MRCTENLGRQQRSAWRDEGERLRESRRRGDEEGRAADQCGHVEQSQAVDEVAEVVAQQLGEEHHRCRAEEQRRWRRRGQGSKKRGQEQKAQGRWQEGRRRRVWKAAVDDECDGRMRWWCEAMRWRGEPELSSDRPRDSRALRVPRSHGPFESQSSLPAQPAIDTAPSSADPIDASSAAPQSTPPALTLSIFSLTRAAWRSAGGVSSLGR